MLIPEQKISEILTASDIVDVVSESVILKRSGRNYFGLCPFHAEKTPSFSVNPDKQIFHCFGCSAGGNAISYIMKYHGISFPEAVRMLARKYNIVVETERLDPARRREIEIKESLFRLNHKVMGLFSGMLAQPGCAAQAYLDRRGMNQETIDRFKLGYAPDKWDTAVTFLRQAKTRRNVAVNSGLILPRKQGNGYYDRFRNRLMFPIFDVNMQVAGFGGRVMDDGMPKYMNSPETPVYSKSRILYGLHAAKQYCRQAGKVFIVEGYFDFLSLFQGGVQNVVASLGTALTLEHVRILKGYASQMILVFDSDDAGINAAKRSIQVFMKEGVDTRILVLPGNNDPDSYVMAHGGQAFLALAEGARTVMQFLLELAMDTHGTSVEGRVRTLDEMTGYLVMIQDAALRSLYVRELAETLNIDEKAVLEKVREAFIRSQAPKRPLIGGNAEKETGVKTPILKSDPRERQILGLMLHFPRLIDEIVEKRVVQAFYSERLRGVAQKIIETPDRKDNFLAAVMAKMDNEDDQALIASLGMEEYAGDEADIVKTGRVLMERIIRIRHRDENTITTKIISAEKGCDADVMELLKLKQQEIRQLHKKQQL